MNTLLEHSGLKSTEAQTEKLRFILLILLVFSLPFDLFYSSVISITLIAATLIDLNREKLKRIKKQVWLFQLPWFLGAVGYCYSLHKGAAGFLLERQLSILLLPVIIPLAITVNETKLKTLLITLTISSLFTVCYLFADMLHVIKTELQLPVVSTALSGIFFNHQFSKPLGIHAGYLSLYLSLSALYLISAINSTPKLWWRLLLLLALLVLFTGLFFLAARNTIITTFIIILFVFPLFKTRQKLKYMLVSTVVVLVGVIIILKVPYLNDRFFSSLVSDMKPLNNGTFVNYGSAEPRIERWKGALELIKKSPVIGYGTGDEISLLKTEYARRGLFISYAENFNAHNQYLSYLLKNGIIGLCLFLLAFGYYLWLAVRGRNFMYLAFLLLLLIGFYTENILDANKGIVFFALFNTVFGYYEAERLSKPE